MAAGLHRRKCWKYKQRNYGGQRRFRQFDLRGGWGISADLVESTCSLALEHIEDMRDFVGQASKFCAGGRFLRQ